MIEQDLKEFIEAGLSGQPVYPVQLPEKHNLPAVVYTLVSSQPSYSCDGPSNFPKFFAIESWGECYEDAKALHETVRALLDGYTGVMGSQRTDLVEIQSESDGFDPRTKYFVADMTINLFFRSE